MLIQLLKVGLDKFLCILFASTHGVHGQGTSIELNQITSYFYTSRGKRHQSSTPLVLILKICVLKRLVQIVKQIVQDKPF